MSTLRKIHPFRRLAWLAIETGVTSWLWRNRREVAAKLRQRSSGPDLSRPIGDRFVPPVADRPPSPFEAARADEAPRPTADVAEHMEAAAAQYRIQPAS